VVELPLIIVINLIIIKRFKTKLREDLIWHQWWRKRQENWRINIQTPRLWRITRVKESRSPRCKKWTRASRKVNLRSRIFKTSSFQSYWEFSDTGIVIIIISSWECLTECWYSNTREYQGSSKTAQILSWISWSSNYRSTARRLRSWIITSGIVTSDCTRIPTSKWILTNELK